MSESQYDLSKSLPGCLLIIVVVFIIPILLYRACGGDPGDDIKHKRNFERRR